MGFFLRFFPPFLIFSFFFLWGFALLSCWSFLSLLLKLVITRRTAMDAALRFGPRCTANDTTDTSRSETNNRREQRKANSERQWQPCQYCGFAVIQRRLCRCNQAQYCDSLCYRRDKPAHRLVCRWGLDTRDAVQWTPCTYCGLGLAKKLKCPCRQVRYCDALCQRKDWPSLAQTQMHRTSPCRGHPP